MRAQEQSRRVPRERLGFGRHRTKRLHRCEQSQRRSRRTMFRWPALSSKRTVAFYALELKNGEQGKVSRRSVETSRSTADQSHFDRLVAHERDDGEHIGFSIRRTERIDHVAYASIAEGHE